MVTIYFNEKNINKWLINKKYAFKYDGGTKKSWIKHKLIETNDNKEDPSEPYVYKKQKWMLEDLKKAQDFVGPPNLGSELKARASETKLRLPKTELPEGYGTGGRISLI